LTNATNANAAAIAQLTIAVNAQPDAIADAVQAQDNATDTLDPVEHTINATVKVLAAANPMRQDITFTHTGGGVVRYWVGDTPPVNYNTVGYIFQSNNGEYVPSQHVKSNWWAIANNTSGNTKVTVNITNLV
jgi:hypothetical protein